MPSKQAVVTFEPLPYRLIGTGIWPAVPRVDAVAIVPTHQRDLQVDIARDYQTAHFTLLREVWTEAVSIERVNLRSVDVEINEIGLEVQFEELPTPRYVPKAGDILIKDSRCILVRIVTHSTVRFDVNGPGEFSIDQALDLDLFVEQVMLSKPRIQRRD